MQSRLAVRVGLGTFVLFVAATLALSAPPEGKGRPGDDDPPDAAGALYGDLYVIERDGKGTPITRTITYSDPETGDDVDVDCLQPLSGGSSSTCTLAECGLIPLNGEKGDFNPEVEDACGVQSDYVDCVQEVSFGRESVSRSPATVLDKSYAEALKALNVAAPECETDEGAVAVTKDPAGRLTLCVPQEDTGSYAWKTIDAPLENLGLYRAVMADGCFGKVTEQVTGEEGEPMLMTYVLDPSGIAHLRTANLGHLVCPYNGHEPPGDWDPDVEEAACTVTPDDPESPADDPCWWEYTQTPDRNASGYEPGQDVTPEDMLSAAVFIAAGADKTSRVTLDEIINVNTYVGVNLWTYERQKKETILTVRYFPFAEAGGPGGWFGYHRGEDACVSPTWADLLVDTGEGTFEEVEVDVFGASPDGVDLRGENGVALTVCRAGGRLMNGTEPAVCDANSENPVYDPENDLYGCGGANWFAQAAEDARKTIWYLHNWRVPEIAY